MKIKLLLILVVALNTVGYAQTNKMLRGKVFFQNFVLENVDVINATSYASARTNFKGEFTLAASVNDSILFYSKDFNLKGIKLSSEDIEQNNMVILIDKKAEELKEVVIHQINVDWKFDKIWEENKRDEVTLYRNENKIKNPGVNDGSIDKPLDLVKVGKLLFGDLFKAKKKGDDSTIDFKKAAVCQFDQKFFTEKLKLKKEEVGSFLDFCDFDPESKAVMSEKSNSLLFMEYLFKKNAEFKKLHAPN
ncbi:hypothetical protein FFWV33_06345 [Flavobacterium faecale]|uniref:Carboxypeptidase-like regulatory domain-containing protein n=1 Tax=Flavobacterium faecale TaxID=1355330 RepID=A0A2S1LBR7_9FLAO|nr:hypothetical protein [Flavobacterium faecale]AWG21182.1 hypothetical protein FFWV33_06345 [Flavobacterium faecale]